MDTTYHFLVKDGDDEYLCESADELNDLIADICQYVKQDEFVCLIIELIQIKAEEG